MVLYLHDIPLEKAQSAFYSELENHHLAARLGVEEVPLDEHALGRVLAGPIWAKISSPHYHASAMDGFASSNLYITNGLNISKATDFGIPH